MIYGFPSFRPISFVSLIAFFSMSAKGASTVSASCFWTKSDTSKETEYAYPDRYYVNKPVKCSNSDREYLLDGSEEEKESDSYRLRCCLYKYCMDLINHSVNNEVTHTVNHTLSLIKELLQSVAVYVLFISTQYIATTNRVVSFP